MKISKFDAKMFDLSKLDEIRSWCRKISSLLFSLFNSQISKSRKKGIKHIRGVLQMPRYQKKKINK